MNYHWGADVRMQNILRNAYEKVNKCMYQERG